jgi:hypothetical protein
MVTVSLLGGHPVVLNVHINRFIPDPNPVTVEFGEFGEPITPVP